MSQYTTQESVAEKAQFAQSNMTLVHMNGINEYCCLNMGEPAVYINSNHNYTTNERGAKTVSLRRGSTANEISAFCLTVAADGSKLPLFAIFKGTGNDRTAKGLLSIIPDGIYGCTLEKGADG